MNFIINSKVKNLIDKQVDSLVKKFKELGEIDIIKYDMEQTSLAEILEEADTYPMWSDYKVVICNNAHFLTSKGIKSKDFENDYTSLEEYILKTNEFCAIVFIVDDKFDKRKKIVKTLEKSCKVFELDKFSEKAITDMVQKKFLKEGKGITVENADYICGKLNYDLSLIFTEVDKLCLVTESELTKEIIDSLISRTIEDNIFELTNAVVASDVGTAVSIYNDLIMNKEEPIAMIGMLASQFRLILQVNAYTSKGYSKQEITSKLKVNPYRVTLAIKSGYALSEDLITRYLQELCAIDYRIKTGKADKYAELELFLLSLNRSSGVNCVNFE